MTEMASTMDHRELTRKERIIAHLKENPFIAIGFVATCGALTMAIRRMYMRDSEGYQRWLRARVVVQGLTVGAIMAAGIREGSLRVGKQQEANVAGSEDASGNFKGPGSLSPADERERRAFQKRMKEAEEAHASETRAMAGESWKDSKSEEKVMSSEWSDSTAPAPPERKSPKGWGSWFGK